MRYGKIVIYVMVVLFVFVLAILWTFPMRVSASTVALQTFVLPSTSDVTHMANTYIILWDIGTGNLVNDAGIVLAANGWTDGDIATAVHDENGLVWTATIPALDTYYEYGFAVFDSAAPAKTDVPTMGPFLYDPKTNKVYSDTNPLKGGKVRSVNE